MLIPRSAPRRDVPNRRNPLFLLVAIAIAGAIGWYVWDTPMDQKDAMELQAMQNERAAVAAGGFQRLADNSAMTRCVQAGTIALQFLQANNDRMYSLWKTNEAAACKLAGIQTAPPPPTK